ncbi:UNKNOWN [Stylonychia lemnae]|uniref:Uncharacterized protein n=1 Tax=Stylonychia lemnae TaxID=5949 RepID=A0A078A8R8_STYLE|nr:UNKNOWN [Stylonychia lemnae]|eukprot:CDW77186.1 UNKNOWN [Stylonychia lemnae]
MVLIAEKNKISVIKGIEENRISIEKDIYETNSQILKIIQMNDDIFMTGQMYGYITLFSLSNQSYHQVFEID